MKAHGLRYFIFSLFTLLLTLIGTDVCFRYSDLHQEILAQDMFSSKLEYFRELDLDPEVVLMGNSRVRHGIDTDVIKSMLSKQLHMDTRSWNFGMGGVTAQLYLPLSLRILEREHKPKVVVFGVAPADFVNATPLALDHLVFSRLWRPADLIDAIHAGASAEQAMDILANSTLELLRFRPSLVDVILRGRKLGQSISQDEFGYKAEHPAPLSLQRIRATNRAKGYRKELVGKQKSVGIFKLGCFRQAVKLLLDAGVRVVVVAMPESSQVHHIASEPDSAVTSIFQKVRETCDSMGIGFADLSSPAWLDDSYFTDGDHMNFNGARLFTTYLVNELIIPELEKSHK